MAYVSVVHHTIGKSASHDRATGFLHRFATLPRQALDWLSAWNDAADEAAASRRVFSPCGAKLTDSMEREMMERVLHKEWL